MAHVIANRCHGFGLTTAGHDQVRALCGRMTGVRAVSIFSSPLLRAFQTAEALSAALGPAITISEALREFDCGELEGSGDPSAWDQQLNLLRTWLVARSYDQRLPGGESAYDVRDRFASLVRELAGHYGTTDAEVVLVGHAGLFAVALPFLASNVTHSFAWEHPVGKAGRIIADWTPQGLNCLSWDGLDIAM